MTHRTRSNRGKQNRQRLPLPLFLGGGALLLIVIGVLLLARPQAQPTSSRPPSVAGAPRLAVDQTKIDFGPVKVDKVVQADFKLTNIGDQPLQILGEPVVQVVEGC